MWKVTAGLSALALGTILLGFLPEPVVVGLAGVIAAILLLASLWIIKSGELQFFNALIVPYLVVGFGAAAFALLQILPLPIVAHPVWRSAAEALDSPIRGSISIAPGESCGALILLLTALSAFASSAAISIDPRRAKWLSDSVLLATVVFSILLIVRTNLWTFAPRLSDFSLRADLLEILIGLPIGLSRGLEALDQARSRPSRTATKYAMQCFGAVIIILASALYVTSRLALIPAGIAIALITLIWLSRRLKISAPASMVVTATLAVIGVASAFALFADHSALPAVIRFSQAPIDNIETSQNLLADVPWLGTGLGTNPLLLPTYASPGSGPLAMATAASVALADIGSPLFWCMCVVLLFASLVLYRGALSRGRDWSFAAAATALLPTILVAAFILPFELSPEGVLVLAIAMGMGASQLRSRARMGPG